MGAYLAPGWYETPPEWVSQGNNYGVTQPALKAQLRIQYKDGSVDWIATDDSWKADISPIFSAEIYYGETYDARRLQAGWDTAAFDDAKWQPVELVHPHEPEILWQSSQPIQVASMMRLGDPFQIALFSPQSCGSLSRKRWTQVVTEVVQSFPTVMGEL